MSTDAASFVLGNENSEFLRIRVLFRPYADYTDDWNVNWIRCEVEIVAGPFSGSVGGNLRTEELARFHQELTQLNDELKGKAKLATADEWISIRVVGNGKGHMQVACLLRDELGCGHSLEARLGFDQTYLPPLLRQLDQVLAAFPVIGNPYA